ncbi:MAG: DUF188 domain-containing protein [Eubacterium sp.]
MRIIIDADACPKTVKLICQEVANDYKLPLVFVADTAHSLADEEDDGYEVVIVDQGQDASDFKIVSMAEATDLIVTQDYGLASLVLDKVTAVLNPNGFVYSLSNMDELLYKRYLNQKMRKAGHGTRIKKRNPDEDAAFKKLLLTFIEPITLNLSL